MISSTPTTSSFPTLSLTHENRAFYRLRGLLPNVQETGEQQVERAIQQCRRKTDDLERNIFLSSVRQSNPALFFSLLAAHTTELLPLVYTPTVGLACEKFSEIYRRPEGMFISLDDKGSIRQVLENWPLKDLVRVAVVTDGSRILGLGDLGLGGLGISVGKLSLYVAGAGIHPSTCLPIVLDMGTNNEALLKDPLYLGLRQKRLPLSECTEFLDEFMEAFKEVFPKALCQFEDFASESAFHYLDRYANKYCMFNDDIQGTGAVILGGFINAAKQSAQASGLPLSDQRIVFLGAGSAAVGVAKQLLSFFTRNGVSEEEAIKRFWLVDTKGLVTLDRGDKLAEHKVFFARSDNEGKQYKTLEEVIELAKPTALVGLSTTRGAFTEPMVQRMAEINPRPIIFPLSNPLSKCELDFEDALMWTKGSVIFASGSPYDPVTYDGKLRYAGQGNNFYVFSALGLGAVLSGARTVTSRMVEETSLALAGSLTAEETAQDLLYPRLDRLRAISVVLAAKVIRAAQYNSVDTNTRLRSLSDQELEAYVEKAMYAPSFDAEFAPGAAKL